MKEVSVLTLLFIIAGIVYMLSLGLTFLTGRVVTGNDKSKKLKVTSVFLKMFLVICFVLIVIGTFFYFNPEEVKVLRTKEAYGEVYPEGDLYKISDTVYVPIEEVIGWGCNLNLTGAYDLVKVRVFLISIDDYKFYIDIPFKKVLGYIELDN